MSEAKRTSSLPIKVQSLTAGYVSHGHVVGERKVLVKELSFRVGPGEIVGIQGPNASGKSTLIKALVDHRFRFGGDVLVAEHSLHPGEVAYVPQSPAGTLSPWLSVREEIALPLRIRKVSRSERAKVVEQLMAQHSIQVPLDRRVDQLSGGQRVKVAVLRALAVPGFRAFIADEPFEGLDSNTRAVLLREIRNIAGSGVPVIVTSHRSQDLDELDARRMVMTGGPVMELRELHVQALDTQPHSLSVDEPVVEENGDALARARSQKPARTATGRATGLLGIIGFAAGLAVWAGLSSLVENPRLLPGPTGVAGETAKLLSDIDNLPNVGATIGRAIVWWIIANAMAIPIGVILGYQAAVYRLCAPWLSLGRCLPVFALLGVSKGLFPGHSELQTGLLIWLTLFLISLHTLSVTSAMAPRRRMEIASIFGAGHRFRLTRIMPFECLSGIFAALEITLPLAVIVTLVVGMFIFPEYGLALDLYNNMDKPDLSKLFACVLVPGAFAAIGLMLVRRLSRRFRFEL